DCRGPVSSQGYNLIGDATGCSFAATTGDRTGTSAAPIDPLLAPLTQSGGPTTTRAPLAGSPLLDSGNPAAASDATPAAFPTLIPCRTTDQRGLPRPFGSACDIGAYEVTAPIATIGSATGV